MSYPEEGDVIPLTEDGVTVYAAQEVQEVDDTVSIRAGPEIGITATKTFCSQVGTLALVAVHVGRKRGTISMTEAQELLSDTCELPAPSSRCLTTKSKLGWWRRITATHFSSSDGVWGRPSR
ncbi:hypothetical protein [Halobellus inordinatus]|uniref:hypothetical protein n=1 Tax=Halobellus inordinatus TaxID=1126236 RepID=UPI0031B81D74